MGCDTYDVKTLCSSGNAIMVTNKDVKATRRPAGSSKDDVKEETHSSSGEDDEDEEEDRLDDPLDKEDIDWLLDRAPGYNAYQLGESFVLFTKDDNDLREAPRVDVPGPYEIEDEYYFVRFKIEEAPKGEEYTELLELAGKFTPPGSKLSFAPGKYSFATTTSYMLEVEHLKRSDSSSGGTGDKADDHSSSDARSHSDDDDSDATATVPFDFELIVGKDKKKETIGVNRALLFCSFPHLESMLRDALTDTKLVLPKLDPEAVQSVLEAFSSRKKVRTPYHHNERAAFEEVQGAFGKSIIEMADEEPSPKRPRQEHPAIADARWLDASFLCGPQREEIKVNRSVLASMNPVLHRILFGTGIISVDPTKPIEWPDFDASAVRQVFLALLHCGKKEFVVPTESVESAKMLVDYLMETREALMLYYDTPFKREYQGRFLLHRGKDGEGLVFSD